MIYFSPINNCKWTSLHLEPWGTQLWHSEQCDARQVLTHSRTVLWTLYSTQDRKPHIKIKHEGARKTKSITYASQSMSLSQTSDFIWTQIFQFWNCCKCKRNQYNSGVCCNPALGRLRQEDHEFKASLNLTLSRQGRKKRGREGGRKEGRNATWTNSNC
jgi:hypothetical protein